MQQRIETEKDKRARRVVVLLPVHNRSPITKKFVDCFLAQSLGEAILVLIDDGCTDGTVEMVRAAVPESRLVVREGNGTLWWAGALQRGYEAVRDAEFNPEDVVVIINDDVVIERGFLEQGAKYVRRGVAVVARAYSQGTAKLVDAGVHLDWRSLNISRDREPNCYSTRGLFVAVGDFLASGGFHPVLLPHYRSDYEFTLRLARLGVQISSPPDLKLWMDEEATGYRDLRSQKFRPFIRMAFSRKAVENPIYGVNFLLLACPRRLLIPNVLRVIARFAYATLRSVKNSITA